MKIRSKTNPDNVGSSGTFNTGSLSEIFVYFDDWMDTDYPSNYDVYLEQSAQWKDLRQAIKDRDVVTDNYNTIFFEPKTQEDRARGYTE